MLAKMIDKIVSLKETKIFEINGQTYADASVEEAKLERLKNRLDGRNNWQGSSLHKWIEKQFSTGGDGHE